MTRKYMAIYEHRIGGYSGFVPDLPGCLTVGESLEEARRGLRKAINEYFAGLQSRAEHLPKSATWVLNCPPPSEGHGIDHWVVEGVEIEKNGEKAV